MSLGATDSNVSEEDDNESSKSSGPKSHESHQPEINHPQLPWSEQDHHHKVG